MKSSELRIGNLFVWSGFASMGQGQDVVGFNNIGCHNLMEPIPLTPEWLERFGFYCPFVGGVYERITRSMDMRFRVHKVSGDLFIIGNYESSARPIQYVHQLQNLYFALTGEELTIS